MKYALVLSLTICITISNATNYFVSSSIGNDSYNGTTEITPWKTIDKINAFQFSPGDSIFLKGGDSWRGSLVPKSGSVSNNIYYGAYSINSKPVILGSVSFNNSSKWINKSGNLWECDTIFDSSILDIGNIILNNAEKIGVKKWDENTLQIQNNFVYNTTLNKITIYSLGNPAILYNSIELALREHIINFESKKHITFENIELKYGSAHGFGGGNTEGITIRNCDISYIGGGELNQNQRERFGNGIEFWGGATNNTVESCKIWEIYDTGLSNQNHSTKAIQHNIKYRNNIIWNCGLASFEYWNRHIDSKTSEIYFENNTCLFAGEGWGSQRPDLRGIHVLIDNNEAETDTIYIRNNIFYSATRQIYTVENSFDGFIKLDYNTVYQPNPSDTLYASFPVVTQFTISQFNDFQNATGKASHSFVSDPLFVDINNLNFQLSSNSPCINTGLTTDLNHDFSGESRPNQSGYDIGAYEFSQLTSTNDFKLDFNIYPNPATKTLRISNANLSNEPLQVQIINSNGQEVLSNQTFQNDESINLESLQTGLYLIRIKHNSQTKYAGRVVIYK